ncbi:putative Gnk2-like domain, protein kinase [Rosa chinensis]|uniref:Putative Gnk2-like domain, protein kinase n=1 Tax=Rosa chinensis TaxID=74649 RepID=A0A2P6Q307_ROSCH|nr:putative Gnk2-like domain, protein kinase [Rosa chinensis]
MVSSRFPSILLSLILLLLTIIPQTLAFLYNECVDDKGNYTPNSTYEENLKTLLSSLPASNGNGYGFYNSSYGSGESSKDQVHVIALCRGDVPLVECRSCLNDSTKALPELCPNQKEAIGCSDTLLEKQVISHGWILCKYIEIHTEICLYSDSCMLRYSNRSIYGTLETLPFFSKVNPFNVSASSLDGFNQELRKLLKILKSEAAKDGSLIKFATGNASAPGVTTIYALVQCTPDLSQLECNDCLDGALVDIPTCCDGRKGGRVIRPSCEDSQDTNEIRTADSLQLDFDTIRVATNNFSEANKLGQGGFGSVYKVYILMGTLLNGEDIAVKRLSINSGQGNLEFKNEVLLVPSFCLYPHLHDHSDVANVHSY